MPQTPAFPPERGLVFYWFLNDHLDRDELRRQLRAFADIGAGGVVLHPHDGLLVPYASREWFDLMRDAVDECAALGLQPWLYDENYCPSGSADGRILMEEPDLVARSIERHESAADVGEGELFLFPAGQLLWAGHVPPVGGDEAPIDRTADVGTIRRAWEMNTSWDSRFYYAQTPVYPCPRGMAHRPELALRVADRPDGWRTVAFVARPSAWLGEAWDGIADSLNPRATRRFIGLAYERYAEAMGDRIGSVVRCIYTDEGKIMALHPWTAGLAEAFQERFGYDLRPRLEDLFTPQPTRRALQTRLHYRLWAAERFESAWLEPIARWCREHNVALVGHLSPEEDLVHQSVMLGDLLRLERHFPLPGLDLIIPAVGDHEHPMLNVAPLVAVSAQQQLERPGVMCETFGAFALELSPFDAGRILNWQVTCGINVAVAHAAFYSDRGLRSHATPPDLGIHGRIWPAMAELSRRIIGFELLTREARQEAPLAVIYPIRSFYLDTVGDDAGRERQRQLQELLTCILETQTGVQLLDEDDLDAVALHDSELRLGWARYRAVLVPPATVLRKETVAKLEAWLREGVLVAGCGERIKYVQAGDALEDAGPMPWPTVAPEALARWCAALPSRVPEAARHDPWLRTSVWHKGGGVTMLANNVDRAAPHDLALPGATLRLAPGELVALRLEGEAWQLLDRFDPASLPPAEPPRQNLITGPWQARFDDEPWQDLPRPQAAYELRPLIRDASSAVTMTLTPAASTDPKPIARSLAYRTQVKLPADAGPMALTLDPTTLRGRVTVTLDGVSRDITLRDLDRESIELDLPASDGKREQTLTLLFHEPASLDGLRLAPSLRRRG